jgi:NAD+ kinase
VKSAHQTTSSRLDNVVTPIAFLDDGTPASAALRVKLQRRYGSSSTKRARTAVVLGGNSAVLRALHSDWARMVPVFGMSLGSASFLTNEFCECDIVRRLQHARSVRVEPLLMRSWSKSGAHETIAFNDVALLRQAQRSASIDIEVAGQRRLSDLKGDGVLVSTPLGSTAYNLSVGGPILPLGSGVIAISPIAPFRPRRWTGAILPKSAQIRLIARDIDTRPVSAVADFTQIRNIREVVVEIAADWGVTILFDSGSPVQERQMVEQFSRT